MKRLLICLSLLLAVAGTSSKVGAALTTAQRKELSEISKNLSRASSYVRRKRVDDATKLVDDAEARLSKLATDAGLESTDRILTSKQKLIETIRGKIAAQQNAGKKGGGDANRVSFAEQVAPILNSRCLTCHDQDQRSGQLCLESFAALRRGGRSGRPLLVPGNASQSWIIARLTAPANQRMPRNAEPLTREQIQTIALWINQGAKYDADSEATPLGQLKSNRPGAKSTPNGSAAIAMATGDETVSFKDDIAPELVVKCLRCHSGNEPRGGLSMETFALLMEGGNSGRVLLPGNVEGSRLFRLVGAREQPRMPQGQARIKRQWFADLQTWIREGVKYDGDDPQMTLRQLVPTDDEKRAMELADMTPAQFSQLREERTAAQFKRVAPRDRTQFAKTNEVYVYGSASQDRLTQIADWAEEHAKSLRKEFGARDEPIWKGKLAVIVFKDRFGYSEFHQVIHQQQIPNEVIGHAVVTPTFEDAYIVLQDVGDERNEQSPGMQVNLIDHMTGAFMKRGGTIPDWVLRGTGMALAVSQSGADNPYITALREKALEALKVLERPEDVFVDGKFSPADVGAVGFTLVQYMMNAGGGRKFGQFIQALHSGGSVNAAIRSVYAGDANTLARSYGAWLLKSQPKSKRSKR